MADLQWLPLAVFIIMPVTIIICYGWAVGLDLVDPAFPYISDTGAFPPVSCFFTLMLNITAVIILLIVFVRHHHIKHRTEGLAVSSVEVQRRVWHSKAAAIIGVIAAVGLAFVASFQEFNVPLWHGIGAASAFFVGTIYMAYQCWFSLRCGPGVASRPIAWAQVGCTVGSALSLLVMGSTMCYASLMDDVAQPDVHDAVQLASSISEWVVALFLNVYILTYVPEFSKIKYRKVVFLYDDVTS